MIGQVLDRYRIESKLGEGGMGVVYKARDTQLDRVVAIKVLPHDKVADPTRKQRFIQEARAASALNHPGIVTLHDIRSDAGIDFIVMEYIEGKTLDQLIAEGRLRPAQALRYAIETADALSRAHAAGIVHRDLKPSNLMLTRDDRIKILDFGLAKLLESSDGDVNATTLASPLTEKGMLLGTVAYMSPEQAEGRDVDARSDIFSFGAVLYEMVTGRKPFTGDSSLKVLTKVLNDDPVAPRQISAAIPVELDKIIIRCLRKDPARRFQTTADLKIALEDVTQESTTRAASHAAGGRWFWPAAAIVVLAAGYFAWRTWPAMRSVENTEPLRAVPLTSFSGEERSPSFSPDGNQIAFSWNGPSQNNRDIYVQQIGSGAPLQLTKDPGNDYDPVWSPDGRWIAFLRGPAEAGIKELRLIPPLGGPERKLAEIHPRLPHLRPTPLLAWCPDSSCLVVQDSAGESQSDVLFVLSLESGEKRQLTSSPQIVSDSDPAISPDGRWLTFKRGTTPFAGYLHLLPLGNGLIESGPAVPLRSVALDAAFPAWTPDSKTIVFASAGGLWRLGIPAADPPTRLPFVGQDGVMPAMSAGRAGQTPRLVYVRQYSDYNIWRLETSAVGAATSSPPAVAISSTGMELTPQFSADHSQVTFASSRSGSLEIWVAHADGSNEVQLTSMAASAAYPRWSPDGKLIAFHAAAAGGQADIFLVPSAGGKPRQLTNHPAVDTFPSFSRDGRWVYFTSTRNAPVRGLWKVSVDGGEPVQLTTGNASLAVESTNGTDIYYVDAFNGPGSIWRVPVSGGEAIKVLDGIDLAALTAVDGGLYYLDRLPSAAADVSTASRPSGEVRLQFFDSIVGSSRTVARNLGVVGMGLTASANGRSILYSRRDSSVEDLMLVENFR